MDAGRLNVVVLDPGLGQAQVPGDAAQLPDQVLPLPDAQIVQEFVATQPPKSVARQFPTLLTQIIPEVEVGHEVGVLVGEAGMPLASGLLAVGRALPWVGDGQSRRQHQHLRHASLGLGLQNHPAQPRVERQPRQAAAQVGDRAVAVERAELLQQLHTIADAAPIGRVEEREVLDITWWRTEPQRRHLQ